MRRTIFTICLVLCCLVLCADIYISHQTATANSAEQSSPGVYQYEKATSPYLVDFYMCGEWEYYPDILIYSAPDGQNFQGGIGILNPIPNLDLDYNPEDVDIEHLADIKTREHAEYQQEALQFIQLPSLNLRAPYHHDSNQVSSYRMVVEGLPPTTDFDMILSLQGLVFGDYELYIDGNRVSAMAPPYGYPVYYFPVDSSGSVEIVLQTRATSSLLNIAPRVAFKGITMGDFDTYRNILLIVSAILFTAFIIMMVLMFSLERRYLYLPFFTGLAFTVNYLSNNLWATGYQGAITAVIPQALLPFLSWLLLAIGVILANLFCSRILTSEYRKKILSWNSLLLAASILCRVLGLLFSGTFVFLLLSNICMAFAVLVLLLMSYIDMTRIARSSFLFQIGVFLMITGSIASAIHNNTGFCNLFLFLQPLSIMIYMVFIFYNNKKNQRDILHRTRELLELEKQSSKIQTAMLSSQIQPHFLYNTLTTIQELCYSDPDEAAELIVTFSQYLRNNLDFMNYEDLIPFSKELEHIHNFMYIQNARYKDAIIYEEDLETTDFLIPPLTVQPIVENAVKHGIMKDAAKGHILLRIYEANEELHIQVINDGKKFTETDLKKGHSMDNIRTRLAHLVNGQLLFHFEDHSPETCVEVVIPLEMPSARKKPS